MHLPPSKVVTRVLNLSWERHYIKVVEAISTDLSKRWYEQRDACPTKEPFLLFIEILLTCQAFKPVCTVCLVPIAVEHSKLYCNLRLLSVILLH